MYPELIPEVRTLLAAAGNADAAVTDAEIEEALAEVSSSLLEQIDDKTPAGATELERAKNADLVTLADDVVGANCGNCQFFRDEYCTHEKVQQAVTERMCCSLWNRPGTQRAWEIA